MRNGRATFFSICILIFPHIGIGGGCSSGAERSLRMRDVEGSIPFISSHTPFVLPQYTSFVLPQGYSPSTSSRRTSFCSTPRAFTVYMLPWAAIVSCLSCLIRSFCCYYYYYHSWLCNLSTVSRFDSCAYIHEFGK